MFNERYKRELDIQKYEALYRNPITITKNRNGMLSYVKGKLINFSSNDYLGLSEDKFLNKKLLTYIRKCGIASSSSRLLTGNNKGLEKAEESYASFFGYESSLFFPSGYQANLAFVSTLFDFEDTVIYDKKIHASIAMGLNLIESKKYGFKHNSMGHLEKRLLKSDKNISVITESLYSMDGDILPVKEICKLKKIYNFNLIIDEAHSFGVLGRNGSGISKNIADIAIGTLGKAFGFNGAFILMPSIIKEYFINFSSPLIYTTALPPYFGPYAETVLEKVSRMGRERSYIEELASYTKHKLMSKGFILWGDAHIISIYIGDEKKALYVSNELISKGILLTACRYPTVPKGKATLRIGINTKLKKNDIDNLINKLMEVINE